MMTPFDYVIRGVVSGCGQGVPKAYGEEYAGGYYVLLPVAMVATLECALSSLMVLSPLFWSE
jgi:hypothetical protein